MLGKYLTIDGVLMPNPNPGTFSYRYNPDENVYTSEAGTQMSNIRRLDRLSFSASYNCSSRLRDLLKTKVLKPSVTVQFDGGSTIRGRLRLGGDISLVENSEYTGGTQGLWVVPITFEGE